MSCSKIICSKAHLKNPFYHTTNRGEKISICSKKAVTIALSIIIGLATFLVGGVLAFYALTAKLKASEIRRLSPPSQLKQIFDIYDSEYRPNKNMACLKAYFESPECEEHQRTAKAYYHTNDMEEIDAKRIMHQREPVNITMRQCYNKRKLQERFGHQVGVFNDSTAIKDNGEQFSKRPNSVVVYSKTALWSTPGDPSTKKTVGVISVPAPALDTREQPHYRYYCRNGKLSLPNYQSELKKQCKMILNIAIHHKEQYKRLVIPAFGQGAFLSALSDRDKVKARDEFYSVLLDEIKEATALVGKLDIVYSEYTQSQNDAIHGLFKHELHRKHFKVGHCVGDILTQAQEGDLIVNAWDPHSMPGNGNDGDASFDGAMGRGSAIALTQSPWLNPHLKYEAQIF
ncbi:MAG: hypothetical protein MRY21_05380 [Simkaniaceae bacterium]|nr:hypothetical protein [Simkaniaceae bacterium]